MVYISSVIDWLSMFEYRSQFTFHMTVNVIIIIIIRLLPKSAKKKTSFFFYSVFFT